MCISTEGDSDNDVFQPNIESTEADVSDMNIMYSDEIRPDVSELDMELKSKLSNENTENSEREMKLAEDLKEEMIRDRSHGLEPLSGWKEEEDIPGEGQGEQEIDRVIPEEREGKQDVMEPEKDDEMYEDELGGFVDEEDVKEDGAEEVIGQENPFSTPQRNQQESENDEEQDQEMDEDEDENEEGKELPESKTIAEDKSLVKILEDAVEPKLEPLEDWNYMKIRDLLSQLNNALYTYSNKLTKDILKGNMFKMKSLDCTTKYERLFSECKAVVQDKINLRQQLDDLRNKYSTMEQTLTKVKDLNEDNRQTIDKLRATRDQCLRTDAEKTKTIETLRNRAVELRRKLSHFRGNIH